MVVQSDLYHITLLRHGESTGNAQDIYQGQCDFPLNETGILQAQALAARWQRERVSFWMERDFGLLSGLEASEAQRRYPFPPYMTPFTPYGETGESRWDVYLRAGRAIQQLLRYPPGRYLVVAHGAILNMAMYIVLGIIPQAHRSGARFALQNTAFAALTYHPVDHTWRLLAFNDHFHWPEGKALQADKTPLSSEPIPPISANSWTIRLATLGDIEGIAQIFLEVDELHIQNLPHVYQRPNGLQTIREDYLTDMLASPDNRLLIAEMGGELIGAVLAILREAAPSPLYVPRRFVVVDTLCVRRAFQRLGVGRVLMEAVHVWGKEKGASAVELTVWEFNAGALAFYQKLGYRTANRRMWIDL